MTAITRIIKYICDCCKKEHETKKNIIEISGQWDGLSDMDYSFHFCNIDCLKKKYEREIIANNEPYDNDYIYLLERELEKLEK
jgi:hypothetical protein